jgi:hypothetical protein
MRSSTLRGRVASVASAAALLSAIAACATPVEPAGPAQANVRVMVKLVHSSEDARAIADQAARVAGVAVSYAAATSPSWHALVLRCADSAACDAAIARLRAAGTLYQAVEVDGRKTRSTS